MLTLMNEEEEDFFKEFDMDIYRETKAKELVLNDIYNALLSSNYTFMNDRLKQEAYVHPDPRGEYEYQFSYFCELGPAGHSNENTIEKLARTILSYGFRPAEIFELKIIN